MKIVLLALSILGHVLAKKVDVPKVKGQVLKKERISRSLVAPVIVVSEVNSRIQSDADLIVIEKLVELGDKVKKGQKLLVLRNQDTTQHFENRYLRAPLSGVVASLPVWKGQFVNKGELLVYLNDPKNLTGRIQIAASDFSKVSKGQSGEMDFKGLGISGIPFEVKGVGQAVDFNTGTVPVDIKIGKGAQKLVAGAVGSAKITLGQEELLLVPEKSLFYVGDDVFIAGLTQEKEVKVKKRQVKLGRRFGGKYELLEGFKEGEKIVMETPQYLSDDDKVIVE